jgi:hypothetical protein
MNVRTYIKQFVNNHKRYVHFCTKLDKLLKVGARFSWVIVYVHVHTQGKGRSSFSLREV